MRFFLFFLLLFFFFIVQISALPNILPARFMPDILLIVLIFLAFYQLEYKSLMALAFIFGLIADIYSGISFGIIVLSFIPAIFLIDLLVNNFFNKADFFVVLSGIAAGSVLYSAFYFGLLKAYELFNIALRSDVGFWTILETALFFTLSNVSAAAILYLPLKKLAGFIDKFKH